MNDDDIQLDSFLRLGYFIDFAEDIRPIDFSRIDRAAYTSASRAELVEIGIAKLNETFDSLYSPGSQNVVPLSGGLDSRLILAALVERVEAGQLYTYTFGVPGSYDYELGCQVAKHVGTRHTALPIPSFTYHEDELLEVARRTWCQAVLFHHPPVRELDRRYQGATIWSGYVGDAVAGSHLHAPRSPTLQAAKRLHLRNRTFVRSVRLHRCGDEDLLARMGGGRLPEERLSWDEQVLFDEAVRKFTAPLVLSQGFNYCTPLINSPWMDFMLSVPDPMRLGESLMIEIGRRAYPDAFRLPSKNRLGHTFQTPDVVVKATFWTNRLRKVAHRFFPSILWPHVLYNDFNEALRTSPDLRAIVQRCLADLRRRKVCDWVDFDGIWGRHERRWGNHGDALIVLASLDLVLRAKESAA